jgi:hypothetical protein
VLNLSNCIIYIQKRHPTADEAIEFTNGDSAMWLPDWLYIVLPHIYAAMGILAIYSGDNAVSVGSGVLLVFTAFLVWKLRSEYKTLDKRHQ